MKFFLIIAILFSFVACSNDIVEPQGELLDNTVYYKVYVYNDRFTNFVKMTLNDESGNIVATQTNFTSGKYVIFDHVKGTKSARVAVTINAVGPTIERFITS